jgi:hypothetical protein
VEDWGNISQEELANLVQSMRRRHTAVLNTAAGHTRYWLLLLILTPLCSGTHYPISVSHMSVELVQFMSQFLNLVMFIQIFTHVENKCSWQWEDVFLLLLSLHKHYSRTHSHTWTLFTHIHEHYSLTYINTIHAHTHIHKHYSLTYINTIHSHTWTLFTHTLIFINTIHSHT